MSDTHDHNRRGTPRVHLMLEVEWPTPGTFPRDHPRHQSERHLHWTTDAIPPTSGHAVLRPGQRAVPDHNIARAYPSDGERLGRRLRQP